ncbi:hypothetical protein KIN20_001242 [Parelaphostrongylus tenuis]|uniref:Uncharacterized protein n=1 Tax=Parelaphostrongylus tenuis TaxID=148309 RepID=A0AAD5MCK8_PARTN|nr:hypothetical protein KIN20_001242 [Parelaphostrongylus tenuis]
MHIKVRDKNWTFAVEEATRRHLSSFVFNSKRDHKVFERLMRENGVTGTLPNAILRGMCRRSDEDIQMRIEVSFPCNSVMSGQMKKRSHPQERNFPHECQ